MSVVENITLNDPVNALATFYVADTENITLGEAPLGFAWVKIDNTESTQWVLVDNRQ